MDKVPLISLENLVASLPEHVYWLDKKGVYQGCNDAQAKMLGLSSRQEIVGKQNKELPCFKNHPEIAKIIDNNNFLVMQSGKAQRLEESAYDANGILSTYLSHKIPLKDANNEVIGLLGSSYKIDDLKARENELLTEKENTELTLKSIIAHLPGHVYWKDKEGHYLGCNDKQAKSLGYINSQDIFGKTDLDLPWKDKASEIRKNDIAVMDTGETLVVEESGTLADGSAIIAISQKVPLKDKSGNVIGIAGISLDVTELKQAQANEKLALQKAAAEEATKRALLIFSGMATHDLRTPLSSIQLRAAFLKKYILPLLESYQAAVKADLDVPLIQTKVLSDLPQAPEDILQAVREANTYIDASLKSLKAAATSEGLMDQDQLVDCNAERLLRRIVDNYPYKPGEEALVHYHTDCDFNFKGNEIFFNRLVENLIKNAFEQIHLKGKGEIFIWCEESPELNTLHLKDTAGGVSQELIDHLFSGIHSSKQGGTGIGLSSAKQIMQGMNGDISARLVDGDCIEFVLSFPK